MIAGAGVVPITAQFCDCRYSFRLFCFNVQVPYFQVYYTAAQRAFTDTTIDISTREKE